MRVLVTGGLGFIGRHLVPRLLDDSHHVTVLDSLSPQIHGDIPSVDAPWLGADTVSVIRGDVLDSAVLAIGVAEADAVVHLAAETGTGQSMYQIARYNAVNSQGTANLLQAMLERKAKPFARLVLSSSRAVYGEGAYRCPSCSPAEVVYPAPRALDDLQKRRWNPLCKRCGDELQSVATPETATPSPASIYAATKLAQEDLVRIFSDLSGVPTVALRFQNVYGEGQSLNNPYTGILSIFSTRIRRGLSLPIFEDGNESRDFIHVDDIARAITLAVNTPVQGYSVFNVGSGRETSVMELATRLGQLLDYAGMPQVTGQFRVGDIRHCYADMRNIESALGFRPEISLDEGLRRFVSWVLGQPLPSDGLGRAESELAKFGLLRKTAG